MKNNEDKLIVFPDLRFPEFRDIGGWENVELGVHYRLQGGFAFKSNEFTDNGIPIIRISNIPIKGSVIDLSNCVYYNIIDNEDNFVINNGDLLIAMSGATTGKTARYNRTGKAYLNQRVGVFRSLTNNYYSFLCHWVNSELFLSQLNKMLAAGAQPNISAKDIESMCFYSVKTRKEQQKIADCLSSIDDLITAEGEKLTMYKEHKKGLLQKLFPQNGKTTPEFRFPEFKNCGEWVEVRLIETVDRDTKWSFIGGPFGSNLKSSDYTATGVRIIQLQNMGDGEFIDTYKIYTSIEKADELKSCNIYPGDIIMSKMGDPVGRACIIPSIENRYVMCSDGIRVVINETKYDRYFVYTVINSHTFRCLVDNAATGSTRKRIGLDVLKNIKMLIPSDKTEQTSIAKCFKSLDELITHQTVKIDALKLHKKGLMQQLFPKI